MGAHAEGLACRAQLSSTLSAAVRALGPEQVLAILPLRLEEGVDAEIKAKAALRGGGSHGDDDAMEEDGDDVDGTIGGALDAHGGNIAGTAGARLWLVPLLRRALLGARLSYFAEEILPAARRLGSRASKAKTAGRAFEAQRCAAAEAALWSLLPAFCSWPEDAAESFPGLAPSLGSALSARADLRGPLTEALRRLIRQAKAAQNAEQEEAYESEGDEDFDDEDNAKRAAELSVTLEDRPDWFTADVAKKQIDAVAKFSRNFLPILFNLFVAAPPERRGDLSATVGAFAQITESAALGGFFRTVLRKLVKVTSDAENAPDLLTEGGANNSQRRCTFMDLSLALVPGLDLEARDLVFKAARPGTMERDPAVQKRAYKLLAALMRPKSGEARTATSAPEKEKSTWLAKNREIAEETLVSGSGSCAPAARRYRLRCVAAILPALMEREQTEDEASGAPTATVRADGSFAALLGELILATKETNARTRARAFKLLVDIPRAMEKRAGRGANPVRVRVGGGSGGAGGMLGAWLAEGTDGSDAAENPDDPDDVRSEDEDEDAMDGETSEDDGDFDHREMGSGVRKFFLTVLAGVVGATPTMQSASVMALARLLYEFSAALVSTVPELLPAVYALLETGDREVVKSCLGFAKVVAVRLPQAELAARLPELVPALLRPCDDDDGFARFKSKTRVVMERLVKRCGWKSVEDATPVLHAKLLQHMKREETRNERRRKASVAGSEIAGFRETRTEAGRSARTGRRSACNDDDVFSGDEGDENDGRGRLGKGGARSAVGGKGAYSVAASRRYAGDGGARSAAAAHARRAVGGARLPGAAAGDTPLDLLDDSAMRRSLLGQRGDVNARSDDDDGEGYARGEGGRLVITEAREGGKRKREEEDLDDARSAGARSNVSRRTAKTDGTMRSGRTTRTARTARTDRTGKAGETGKTARGENRHSADAYRAKKGAKGDVRDKSRKLEPYAYWPLDPKLLNRRASKKAAAKDGLARVVRDAKSAGIRHGQKAKDEAQRR
jgi:ribosomal RNA-processing protein 12